MKLKIYWDKYAVWEQVMELWKIHFPINRYGGGFSMYYGPDFDVPGFQCSLFPDAAVYIRQRFE